MPSDPTTPLRRLPGRSPIFTARDAGRTQLWVGSRQLVQEIVRGSTQEIQRFNLADIQAIQIRRTMRGLVYNVIFSLLLVIVILITFYATGPLRSRLIYGSAFGVPLLGMLVLNIYRGATSRTMLVTALGPQRLTSLSRFRPAVRALDAIRAAVETVQGAMSPVEASRQVEATRRVSQAAPIQR